MKKLYSKKGFTLIELLIVIAIIAVLAVAFLPSLLGAPAKGRDTSRIADLQKIQKVLVSTNLEKGKYPTTTGQITGTLVAGVSGTGSTWLADFGAPFGGEIPTDPTAGQSYYYLSSVNAGVSYSFGLWAQVENLESGNANCATVTPFTILISENPAAPTTGSGGTLAKVPCYAILTQ